MFIAILGRQPELSIAELEAVFGGQSVQQLSRESALVETSFMPIEALGGSLKCGQVVQDFGVLPGKSALRTVSDWVLQRYAQRLASVEGKITLGLSAYGFRENGREIQKIGLPLKSALKKRGVSLRLIPNVEPALSTATSHNNKLGLSPKKIELLIVRADNGQVIVAESRGAQNITAYARRDRQRPRRDAFVGMLPPKLAQIMVNLAVGGSQFSSAVNNQHILDPFCGTGTVLQEALLKGYSVHGSDLSQKMVDYTRDNLGWLSQTHRHIGQIVDIRQGDATSFNWAEAPELAAVVCETYLGQPFSAPPKPDKLKEVVGNCNHIITDFLKNLHSQIVPRARVCLAVPAWRDNNGQLTHLPLIRQLERLGYQLEHPPLLYSRPDQVVAREILIIRPKSLDSH